MPAASRARRATIIDRPPRRAVGPRSRARCRNARARGGRPCSISSSTSLVVARPSMFSMKLACLGAKRASPTCRPLQPAASSNWPAVRPSARGSSGFLKVEPKVLMPDGCAAWRCCAHPGERLLHRLAGRALERERSPRHDLARPDVRAAVGEAELVGRAALAAGGGADVDPVEHRRQLAAVGVGVHAHGAADGAGDVDAELDAGEAELGGARGDLRQPGAAAADEAGLHPVLSAPDLRPV